MYNMNSFNLNIPVSQLFYKPFHFSLIIALTHFVPAADPQVAHINMLVFLNYQ